MPESGVFSAFFNTCHAIKKLILCYTERIIYRHSPTCAGDNAAEFLEEFHGYLMCDGYSGYNKVPGAKRIACRAHILKELLYYLIIFVDFL